jgi:MYXO-CTERM domain-containing protein
MRRIAFAALTVVVVALPPAAAAKGPHAVVSSLPVAVEVGRPWAATLTLVEYSRREATDARPRVILRRADEQITVVARRLGAYVPGDEDVLTEARYRLRVVFPRPGRWTFTVLDGTEPEHRFRFPAAVVRTGSEPERGAASEAGARPYVAFPEGSSEEAAGAGGPVLGDPYPPPAEQGRPLPPEVVFPANDESDRSPAIPWIPAAGLALAGLGGLAVVRHRRRRPG